MSEELLRLLALLIEEAVIANFEYWGEFIIRLQRDDAKRLTSLREWFGGRRIPSIFCLRLRAEWWVGERAKWTQAVQQFPMKAAPPMPVETALQASTLVMMLDCEVTRVIVSENSDLMLILSDGRRVTVRSTSERWDESWFLELPVDDPDRDQWAIVCDSAGVISGKFPSKAET